MKRFSSFGALKVLGICLFFSSCGDPAKLGADGGFGRIAVLADGGASPTDVAMARDTTRVAPSDAATEDGDASGAALGVACGASADCGSGFCVDGVCCDTACDGACRSCGLAARPGTCSPVIGAADPGTCEGDQACGAEGTCGHARGVACAQNGDCASGACVDGVCCGSDSCATCQRCNLPGSAGSCAPVPPLTDDGDSGCSGTTTCDGVGGCKQKNGRSCSGAVACASGFCADGLCCNQACGQTCYSCAVTGQEGSCVVLAAQDDPVATAPCDGSSTCEAGGSAACKLKEGATCVGNADCAFGVCRTFYRDADGDGFGAAADKLVQCAQAPTPPAGYATSAGDCCDRDARVHPGQAAFFSAVSACGPDYNCDGRAELQYTACTSALSSMPAPACGGPCFGADMNGKIHLLYTQACR